MIKSNLWEK